MKKRLLLLLFFPLIFSCSENHKEEEKIEKGVIARICDLGKLVIWGELIAYKLGRGAFENWSELQTWAARIYLRFASIFSIKALVAAQTSSTDLEPSSLVHSPWCS